ncbi:hypothetical protein VTK56DRAFT_9084 [Thermocarpiscus australiensis]
MVSTRSRRSAPTTAPPDGRRETSRRTNATRRSSDENAASGRGTGKRKRDTSVTAGTREQKRARRLSEVRDSIEVKGQDEDEDYVPAAVVEMMNAASKLRAPRTRSVTIEIPLRSSPVQRRAGNDASNTDRDNRRPQARRLRRGVKTLEVLAKVDAADHASGEERDGEEAREEEEKTPTRSESPGQDLGSPELQSSALRRRPAKPAADIYDVPESEESELHSPVTSRRRPARKGNKPSSRPKTAKESDKSARLASVHEEEGEPRRASPESPPRLARQNVAPQPARCETVSDDEEPRRANPEPPLRLARRNVAPRPARCETVTDDEDNVLVEEIQAVEVQQADESEEEEEEEEKEEEEPRRANPESPPRLARQNIAPRPARCETVTDDEDNGLVVEVQQADESEEEEEEEADSGVDDQDDSATRSRGDNLQDAVVIQIHANGEAQHTVTVYSTHVSSMLRIMGSKGWTGSGNRWNTHLLRSASFNFDGDAPALTKLGKSCFKLLVSLKRELDDVPCAPDLSRQFEFLTQEEQPLNRAMTNVNRVVARICAEGLPVLDEPNRSHTNWRYREALVKDLTSSIIPMLVLVLRSSFTIGVTESNFEDTDWLPEEGFFTRATVQYMLWVTGWLLRLVKVLALELRQRAREDDRSTTDQTAAERQEHKNSKKDREKFGVMLRKWKEQLMRAVDEFNERTEKDRDRLMKVHQDIAIKEAKRRAEEEELARKERQYNACRLSLQRIARLRRPLAEQWRKATQHWSTIPQSSQYHEGSPVDTWRSNSSSWTQSRPVSSGSSSARSAPAQRPSFRAVEATHERLDSPLELNYTPWPEDDTEWFLGELKRPDRKESYLEVCAEVLERPLLEVRLEKERLKRAGRYQSP